MSRYQFNRDQLRFVEVQKGISSIFKRVAVGIVASLLLSVLYYFVFSSFFNTPEEWELIREQQIMGREYEQLGEKMKALNTVLDELEERDREIYRTVFQSNPSELGIHGQSSLYNALLSSNNFDLVYEAKSAYQKLEYKAGKVNQLFEAIAALLTPDKVGNIPDRIPLREIDLQRVGATVGNRIHPYYKTVRMHTGIDFVAVLGTDVLAPADGVVVELTRSSRGSGNSIAIEHDSGYTTVYAHLQDILVRKGQKVSRGSIIARVGNSGLSWAPHLHYEIRKGAEIMNPVHFFYAQLKPHEYRQLMVADSGQSLD